MIAASKEQASECFNYIEGMFATAPYLAGLLASPPTASTLTLRSRVEIQVRSRVLAPRTWFHGHRRHLATRWPIGLTRVAPIPTKKSLERFVQPSEPRNGPLIMISSPYAKRGALYDTFRRHYGEQGHERIVVVKAPSKTMNPILSGSGGGACL